MHSAVYDLRLDWNTEAPPEVWQRLCKHYEVEDRLKELEENETNGMARLKYGMTVQDDPLVFKSMFPDLSVTVGKPVSTTQGFEILHALRRIESELQYRWGQDGTSSRKVGVPNKPTYETDGVTRAALPEWFIAHIRKVEVRTDHCTDNLQSDLDGGWHILAICPQPGQRRPGYILGRF